jgi:3-mercaptopyruvate sulfurtransferase SseA
MRSIKQKPHLIRGLTLFSLFITLLLFIACGGGQYSDPEVGVEVMISPQTLNSWLTDGYGQDAAGYRKIVVLDVNSTVNYELGHVPGAYHLNTAADLSATRSDGVADTRSMVATKAQMDDLIQRTGIDENTVVIITGTNMMEIGRAYFNFRYWGFPRSRLRVLNGSTTDYKNAGYDLVATYPAPAAPSTYSVCNLEQNTYLRASLAEMRDVAAKNDDATKIIDVRTPGQYGGTAPQASKAKNLNADPPVLENEYVAFEGHISMAININHPEFLTAGNASPLKTADDLKDIMTGAGVKSSDTTYSYCFTSWRAGVFFLAMDALLDWPTKIYDGAWVEWGQMAENGSAIGGALEATSFWRTDLPQYSGVINYNKAAGRTVEALAANSFALQGDLVNRTDANACGTGVGGGGGQTGGY